MKERIVGAAVLVVFVVLVVPIFLDGPPGEEEIRTESVALPGQEGQQAQTVVLERDRTEPVPVNAGTEPPAEQPQADAPPAEPAAEPAPTEQSERAEAEIIRMPEPESTSMPSTSKVPTAATSTTGMWAVQLGSFSNKANAEKLVADLRKQQYLAFLSQVQAERGTLHRVRIGPQKDRAGAEAMAARLAKAGYPGQVVPHP
ncbi:MAG: SPOR domain-containing protein [Gammaproteobacteria bacterium]|nr:SPOR domain-containing protein [Gammaproteobacteria bacterium]NNF50164.1 SPOR domain-containing protein [Woeseiaceae bacterium]MBT8093937.1 SPOR domain-containing protein [Gammaproteobacteria bacterium]MBT8106169.1 SPOR domain-containing protein [Gammaproteobacteria bacterium]NNK26183.1 SPOR domain-containing protein [Woeseiaceae bacterium]